MDLEPILRTRRKDLVLAAESVVREAQDSLPDKTQLNRLISICGEATCAEEIENYLRYQASRQTRPWPPDFARLVIAKLGPQLDALSSALPGHKDIDRDRAKVAAWRLYAVFLTRASTYAMHQKGKDHDRARR